MDSTHFTPFFTHLSVLLVTLLSIGRNSDLRILFETTSTRYFLRMTDLISGIIIYIKINKIQEKFDENCTRKSVINWPVIWTENGNADGIRHRTQHQVQRDWKHFRDGAKWESEGVRGTIIILKRTIHKLWGCEMDWTGSRKDTMRAVVLKVIYSQVRQYHRISRSIHYLFCNEKYAPWS